jgi:hypothetical protein
MLAADAVQLLGIWGIRAELGAAWDAMAAKAHNVAERRKPLEMQHYRLLNTQIG